MRLMATQRWNPPGPSMRARWTVAMPPRPISEMTRYLPMKSAMPRGPLAGRVPEAEPASGFPHDTAGLGRARLMGSSILPESG